MAKTAKDTTRDILAAAVPLAERIGFANITRTNLAEAAGVSPALVSARLGTMKQAYRDIMRAAVKAGCVRVVAQGIAAREPAALRAPQELKDRCAAMIKG